MSSIARRAGAGWSRGPGAAERSRTPPREPTGAAFLLAALATALVVPGGMSRATDLVDTAALGDRGAILETVGDGFFAISDARGIGDFDGDGLGDIAVAFRESPYTSGGPLAVALVHGRSGLSGRHDLAASLPGAVVLRVLDPVATGSGTVLVAPAGDLDGDGLADFFFSYSAYRRDPGAAEGTTFLVYGSGGLAGEGFVEEVGDFLPGVVLASSDPSYHKVDQDHANIGDFNGDGEDDVAMGGFSSTVGNGLTSGMVSVLLRTRGLPPAVDPMAIGRTLPGFRVLGRSGEGLGKGIVAAGDVDGDGLADFLVSAGQEAFSGRVYLVFGRKATSTDVDLQRIDFDGSASGPSLGASRIEGTTGTRILGGRDQIAGLGDVNGDGFDDFAVGATRPGLAFPGDGSIPGAVYLFYGRPDFPSLVDIDGATGGLATTIHSPEEGAVSDSFGTSVARAGDMDGDGSPDFLIGAPRAVVRGRSGAGEAYLLHGRADLGTDLFLGDDLPDLRVLGEATDGGLGRFVSEAGDFDGDGARDILVVAPVVAGLTGQGRAYIIRGSGSGEPPFTVLDLDPPSGPRRGGTQVRIRGSGFKEPLQVIFGDRLAAGAFVESGSAIRAVSPSADRPGAVDVRVTVAGESRQLDEQFEYTADLPEIDLASPGLRGLRLDGESGAEVGHSLAFGDVNADGVEDLIIGSELEGWTVSVVIGGRGLPEALPALTPSSRVSLVKSSTPRPLSGARVAVVGDVNGDGVSDVGIGVSGGAAYILFGRRTFPPTMEMEDEIQAGGAVLLDRGPFEEWLSLARLGDVTGDGIDDFAVGFAEAPVSPAEPDPGAGEILFVEGLRVWPEAVDLSSPSSFYARIHGIGPNHFLAEQLVLAGDVNGDGLPDLLANSLPGPGGARTYVIFCKRELPPDTDVETYIAEGGGVFADRVGRGAAPTSFINVSAAGDINGDGLADFLLGDESGGELDQGVTFLVPGSSHLPLLLPLPELPEASDGILRVFGAAQRVQSGRAIGPAGDFNRDGFDDFIVGSQNVDPFGPGNLCVVFGGSALPGTIDLRRLGGRGLRLEGIHRVTLLDSSAHETGDLNGDGRPDFAFAERGSPTFPAIDGAPPAGGVHVVFGLASDLPFVRGDASFDGILNITDAILGLNYLFGGGSEPSCLDAFDADDSGTAEITDAIFLLNFLFLGGPQPPPPYPDAGPDPTADGLHCDGY